jgi:SAM-dependent methyltransferase
MSDSIKYEQNTNYSQSEVARIFEDFAKSAPQLFKKPGKRKLEYIYHLLDKIFSPGGKLIDLGGGVNPVNGVITRWGASVTVLDIFEYDLAYLDGRKPDEFAAACSSAKAFLEAVGVNFHDCDLCTVDLKTLFAPNSIDAIFSTHCLEHFHQSPRIVLQSALEVLKPGGNLLLEVPNSINLLKRIQVLLGKTNYGSYNFYYDAINYTGHVREYSVADFHALARKLGLETYSIYGKNWFGTLYEKCGDNSATAFVDKCLQRFPGLCGSLFLAYTKPAGER